MQLEMFSDAQKSNGLYIIKKISYYDTLPFLLNIHYAKRIPHISYSFGLFLNYKLVGVITYGQPSSPNVASSIVGNKYKNICLELNRLVLKNNKKNEASILISQSLKFLKRPRIIISFADPDYGHYGYVYQATNFIYLGKTTESIEYKNEHGNDIHFRNIGHYQKNNKFGVKLIKKRVDEDKINKVEIALFLKKNKGKFTNKKLDQIFMRKDTASHWFRLDKGFSFPNVDDWIKLKKLLNFDDTFDQVMTNYVLIPDSSEIIKKLKLRKIFKQPKFRYVYLLGTHKEKKNITACLKLKKQNYPKKINNEKSIVAS
tara:strand:+ start:199 stop:1143 length:945 start_codon:yes stop_codon:yes gene_type:complete